MQETSFSKVTSTPLDPFQRDLPEENDSGYHSNLSCINSSNNTTRGHVSNYSFTGREYVDFLYLFGERSDHSIIIKKILNYLGNEDLHNVTTVSKTWKSVVMSVSVEKKRLRSYIKERQTTKENRTENNGYEVCEDKNNYPSPRSRLKEICNLRKEFTSNSPMSSSSPPLFTNHFRFEAYQKEGRKLKLGKRLYSCPKCKLPSHPDQKVPNIAECTNSTCSYRFCILCQCQEHFSKMCDFISTPVARKQSVSLGTVKSKKNLKRLLI